MINNGKENRNDKEREDMNALLEKKKKELGLTGLNEGKINILKKAKGTASSKIDLNKVRDYWKYESD